MEKNLHKCPATDPIGQASPQTFACPDCSADVEIWTDETSAKCPVCKVRVIKSEAALRK